MMCTQGKPVESDQGRQTEFGSPGNLECYSILYSPMLSCLHAIRFYRVLVDMLFCCMGIYSMSVEQSNFSQIRLISVKHNTCQQS